MAFQKFSKNSLNILVVHCFFFNLKEALLLLSVGKSAITSFSKNGSSL